MRSRKSCRRTSWTAHCSISRRYARPEVLFSAATLPSMSTASSSARSRLLLRTRASTRLRCRASRYATGDALRCLTTRRRDPSPAGFPPHGRGPGSSPERSCCAHAAFRRFDAVPRNEIAAGATYAIAATLAAWLHPVIAPFVLAPFLWAAFEVLRDSSSLRRSRLVRLAALAVATGAPMAALLLPPLFAHPEALTGKALIDRRSLETLAGVWYAWLGTPSTFAVLVCCAMAAYGAREVWRA